MRREKARSIQPGSPYRKEKKKMAFIDRVVEHPGRYILTNAETGIELGTFDLVRAEGDVYTDGTLLNANNLNTQTQLDGSVEDLFTAAGMTGGTYQNEMSDALGFLIGKDAEAYVTEYGTKQGGTGNNWWSYRKWSNGTIELFGVASASGVAGTLWSNGIYYYDWNITWPTGIFDAAPTEVYANGGNYQWIVGGIGAASTTGVGMRMVKPTSSSQTLTARIHAFKYPTS